MKLLVALALVCLVGSVVAEEKLVTPTELDYHLAIGVPAAARIKTAEQSPDFPDFPDSFIRYPYLGGVLITLDTGDISVCGCSLLTHTRAVFAAHCVTSRSTHGVEYTAVFGSPRLYSGGTRRTTKEIQKHLLYDVDTHANDIALLYFEWVTFTDYIHNISLACETDQFNGTWVWATRFGLTSDPYIVGPNQFLSHVEVRVITNSKCKETFGSSIQESNMCAVVDSGHCACDGEDGGPLVANGHLIGIGIYYLGYIYGCECRYPNVFMRVSAFASWIRERL